MPSTSLAVPRIGQVWPGQGGIYRGIVRGLAGAPDQFLILADAAPPSRLNWSDAVAWALAVSADGHTDFGLPTRPEGATLFATNACELEGWLWLGEQYSREGAWGQLFGVGSQGSYIKSYEGRARAVRRFNVQSLIHSIESEAIAA